MRLPNGYGSVIKMSGKRRRPYAIRLTVGFTDDGKQKYKYLSYHRTKSEAITALAEFNRTPYDIEANRITFAEVYERLTKELSNHVSASVLKLNKTCYNHCSELHGMVFKELRKAHLQGIIDNLSTPTAKANVASFFRKLFKFALEHDIVLKDYSQFIVTPPKNRKSEKVPFTVEELNVLWGLEENVNAEILLILAYSGMRISELLTLRKEQINIEGKYIITGSKTEAGRDRYIPIHDRTLPLVLKHYNQNNEWLITNSFGTKPIRYDSFHAKRFTKLMRKLDMRSELTPHSTRHFFISELHKLGADKIAVQKIVGHKGADVTEQSYTHINAQKLHEIVNMLP